MDQTQPFCGSNLFPLNVKELIRSFELTLEIND